METHTFRGNASGTTERKEVKKEVVRVHNDTSLVIVLNTGTGNLNGWYGYTYNTSQALNFIGFMT